VYEPFTYGIRQSHGSDVYNGVVESGGLVVQVADNNDESKDFWDTLKQIEGKQTGGLTVMSRNDFETNEEWLECVRDNLFKNEEEIMISRTLGVRKVVSHVIDFDL
jgi:hypothetical protein